MYVITALDGAQHPLRWALPFVPITAGAAALALVLQLRRPRGIQLLILEPGRITFQRNDGSSETVRDALRGIEENEHSFTIRLRVAPDRSLLAKGLTVHKSTLSGDSAAMLRRLGQPPAKDASAASRAASWLN
jgi:hypothetical protein